ncbi:EF-hand domain-containing protein [Rhizorhabdus wittichii]|uniref:EF-hand domain-containing protein n=1 Tax=Rhizorhabdus wittichii TaxID=160791 RepID=A0A975HG65_9SPHN|nr:EF-hand domain-containing protein [Rhizorhabdus wittichii]QTH24256.1 EF-hand domain-containing protein [Rhizorhabdus wittichii]
MTRLMFVALLSLSAASAAHAGLELGQRPITRAEVAAVAKKQFAEMDADRNGFVSPAEFERYREIQNAQPDQGRGLTHIGRSWFDKCDTNGDGKVSQAEALARPLGLFDMADANRDGVASVAEQSVAMLFMK